MKHILFALFVLVIVACIMAPGTPRPKPTKEPPPTEPVVTEQIGTVEPPEITEIPPGPPPHIIPTERGKPNPEANITPSGKPEPREIRLPASGYGPQATLTPEEAEGRHDVMIVMFTLLIVVGLFLFVSTAARY